MYAILYIPNGEYIKHSGMFYFDKIKGKTKKEAEEVLAYILSQIKKDGNWLTRLNNINTPAYRYEFEIVEID